MGYRTLRDCVNDLRRTGQLVTIDQEVDPSLEAAEIHRRVFEARGPAIYFARVRGTPFPMVSNLFGTIERARFLFRDTFEDLKRLIELKLEPAVAWARPWRYLKASRLALAMRPKRVRSGPALLHQTAIEQLPRLVCWPGDGGPFITLPQVYTEDPFEVGFQKSNLGMYRVQLAGNEYNADEVGLHYQIHRGIGVHHARAIEKGESLRANICVGGPPAFALAAVMPLPEGMSELTFAGALGGRRVAMADAGRLPAPAESDFVISGSIDPNQQKPEGPFGDHLGYYSLRHPFPVLRVERVYHRPGAIWPFTVVGRPPQEDSIFGELIHELTGPVLPTLLAGVYEVHAVDAAGVHPLLLAIGSERYVPYAERDRPRELLTQANAILGQGQLSLAKYLWIVAREDDCSLRVRDIRAFVRHVLERVDWRRDLHFITETTMDTLDYSGGDLNCGSKLVVAAVGPRRRDLGDRLPGELVLPAGFGDPRMGLSGVLLIAGPRFIESDGEKDRRRLCECLEAAAGFETIPLVVLVDDAAFAAHSLENFLWVTFTRSDPARDVDGAHPFCEHKHWGCRGPVVLDARLKPWHPPPLEPDPEVSRKVERWAAPGGPLHGIF